MKGVYVLAGPTKSKARGKAWPGAAVGVAPRPARPTPHHGFPPPPSLPLPDARGHAGRRHATLGWQGPRELHRTRRIRGAGAVPGRHTRHGFLVKLTQAGGALGLRQRRRPALLPALSRKPPRGSWTPEVMAKGVLVSAGPTKSKARGKAWPGAAGGVAPRPAHSTPHPGFSPPRPLPRQAHAAMLADVMQLWADGAPVNYTAHGAYGLLDQYLGGIRAMVGPEGRGQVCLGVQDFARRPRRARRPPAPPRSLPCRSRRHKMSRPCS